MSFADKNVQREYQRLWVANRREKFFFDKSCVDCGSVSNLELDHINPEEKISHRIWSWSEERLQKEIVKCQVLCQPCHIKKTNKDLFQGHIVHGELYRGYRNGCRCDLCREARKIDSRLYRGSIAQEDRATTS